MGVAFPYTPFQVGDAFRMMFRFPWEVLHCIVVGNVGTLLLGLLFQMLHRPGLSGSQSHRRRASGVFGLFCGECLLRGSTGCCFQFTKAGGAGVLTPLTGTTTRCQADTSVFPMTAQVKREATRTLSNTLVSQNSDTCSCFPWLSVLPLGTRVFAASDPVAVESGHERGCGGCRAFAADVVAWGRCVCLVRVCCFLWFTNVQIARPSAAVDPSALFPSTAPGSQLSRSWCDMKISRLVPSLAQLGLGSSSTSL